MVIISYLLAHANQAFKKATMRFASSHSAPVTRHVHKVALSINSGKVRIVVKEIRRSICGKWHHDFLFQFSTKKVRIDA